MSRREQALSVLHRLRALQQSKQALEHRRAQQEVYVCNEALLHARSELAAALRQAGDVVRGSELQLERQHRVGQMLSDLQQNVQSRHADHVHAVEECDAAAQAHLFAQQHCDHAADALAVERALLQQQRDLRDYDYGCDLRLARTLAGAKA
ncbi:hypothetical protein VPH13_12375 [Stenotrophomonas pavanii]|uniref:hypothetical protein n=1 Tax=Stenotrophomonas pavanii TaxID=487698 RepID=UPI0019D4B877|nr:hypothetical protein [Stenotrophomonas pavanii]MBN7836277.1 hypothetical protein [Stenotrophomonas maltophilia]MEC4339511.1 hypothetical protein [Stenotrophomonas pavanii]